MTTPALPTSMTRGEKTRLILASIARILLGFVLIWWVLTLLPDQPDERLFLPVIVVIVGVVGYGLYFRREVRRIKQSRYPFIQAIEALILLAAMFLAVFAGTYVLISTADPVSFTEPLNHFTAYYYALTVLATVGFGDITPVSTLARSTSMLQMAIDIAFVSVLLKVVTTAAQSSRSARQTGKGVVEDLESSS